jgi:hypothetical protein
MINIKKLLDGGINADDSHRAISPAQLLNLENLRTGISEFSKNFSVTNLPSTELLYDLGLPYDNITIGRVRDESRLRITWMAQNSNGLDGIYSYDIQLGVTYVVLLDSQLEEGFNFSTSFRISKNARMVGDLLFLTDDNNEPLCINVEAGIKTNDGTYSTNVEPYDTPIPYTTLTVIRRIPIYPLEVVKGTDGGFDNNFIINNSYQFFYRYWNKNYQFSALSPASKLIPYNGIAETNNYITIAVPYSETIDDETQQIDIIVRYGNTGGCFIIKSYNKDYYYDAVAIADHNAGGTQLGFAFYDNAQGTALDSVTSETFFHNVALKAKTLEVARNRLFFGNVLKGYDTPVLTSLEATVINSETGGGTFSGQWGYVTIYANFPGGCANTYNYPFVYINTGATYKFYYFSSVRTGTIWNGGLGTVPSTININDAVYSTNTESDLPAYLKAISYPFGGGGCVAGSPTWNAGYSISAYFPVGALGAVTVYSFTPVAVNNFFKSNSVYEINIEFKDRFGRRCGVQRNGASVTIPERVFTQTSFGATIQWDLSNVNATTQIPDWADTYQIVIKKNQTTRFFLQGKASNMDYVLRGDDGTYSYGHTTLTAGTYAVGVNLSELTGFGFGYSFTEGDFCRVYLSTDVNYNQRILGVDGNWLLLAPVDMGTLNSSSDPIFEIYTPYRAQASEPYYETGSVYPIANPRTINRSFTTLTGTINGDTYAIQRTDASATDYIVEAMSPNDNVWQIWQTDTGWVNYVDTIGQRQKETSIDYSDTFINGTKVNGLNVFQPLSTEDVGNDTGAIQKLQLTNKKQEDGTIMLCITQAAPLSIYLGETQVVSSVQNAFLATSSGVIGTKNALKNGFGTIHPESVTEYNGSVWWFDAIHGVVCQYDVNGVVPISFYKMRRYFDKFGKRYIEQGAAAIEALCGFSYIESCIDPSTSEFLLTVPQTETNVVTSGIPVGYAPALPSYTTLPDYATSIQNRFDIYDGQPKCLGKDTEVLMYDFTIKKVQDIIVGDKLMGLNGQVRNVISIADGVEQMYWVRQKRGIDYRVNESHILSLKNPKFKYYKSRKAINWERENISVLEFINKPSYWRQNAMGHKSECLHFKSKRVTLSPYFLGLWLGDGNAESLAVTTVDEEIISYLHEFAVRNNAVIRRKDITYYIVGAKKALNQFKKYKLFARRIGSVGKRIPYDYLKNTEKVRLELLAGLLDSDGSLVKEKCGYRLVQKREDLAKDISLLARSLGFYVGHNKEIAKMKRSDGSVYECPIYVNSIWGDVDKIPVRISRKKAKKREINKNHLHTGIKIEKDIVDNYYGFELDGDGLFMLSDFTVTHNTMVYKYDDNKWNGAYLWLPDCMEYVGNKLFGFKNGNLYLHNETTSSYNNIYGVQYPQRICFVGNLSPSTILDLLDVAIEGNGIKPSYTVAYAELPDEQITDLTSDDFINKEGVEYATWFRDRLSPNTSGDVVNKLYNGDVMKSPTLLVMIEFTEYSSPLVINFINLGVDISKGHLQINK